MELNHPKSLWVLSFGKLWDTFSYFGTQTILALYFIHVFHMDRSTSYLIYGAYAAFAFASPTLGGMVADRWLGSKHSLMFGCSLNILGNLMLMSFDRYLFCFGLATSLIGSGLYKSTSTHLVGSLYKDGDLKKESGFTWFYLAINVGGTLGPLVYGFVIYALGWNYGFLCSAIGIAIGAIWFLSNWSLLETSENHGRIPNINAKLIFCALIAAACLLLSVPFYIPYTINPVILTVFAISIIYLISAIIKYKDREKIRLFAILLLSFFGMFYFAAGLQIGTTITLFLQYKIQQGDIATQLPASTFSMLYSLFVLLLAPFASLLWKKLRAKNITLDAPIKLSIGIGLATAGIAAFAFASITNLVITGVIVGYLLLSAGELVLTPAIYTAISDSAPFGMKNTMMGCWFLFVALGGYFSSVLATASHFVAKHLPLQHKYLGEFLFITLFTLLVVIIVAFFTPKLSKMLK